MNMLSDNVQYSVIKPCTIMDSISPGKQKLILNKTYAGRELISVIEGMNELTQFVNDDRVIKINKLKGITEMIFNLIILITLKIGNLATSYLPCDC